MRGSSYFTHQEPLDFMPGSSMAAPSELPRSAEHSGFCDYALFSSAPMPFGPAAAASIDPDLASFTTAVDRLLRQPPGAASAGFPGMDADAVDYSLFPRTPDNLDCAGAA
jgi:hypothetical protein